MGWRGRMGCSCCDLMGGLWFGYCKLYYECIVDILELIVHDDLVTRLAPSELPVSGMYPSIILPSQIHNLPSDNSSKKYPPTNFQNPNSLPHNKLLHNLPQA